MKIVLAGALAALAVAGATLTATAPAQAGIHFGISINEGDVMFAYRDGYWDRYHRWHPWAGREDWRWYREHHPDRYSDWAHDRDRDMGWRAGGGAMMGGPGVVVGVPGFSFAVGDVAFAYRDGFWDRAHRWHPWRSDAERIWWRDHYHDRYWDWRHDRDPDLGWRVAGRPGVVVGVPGFSFAIGDVAYAYRDGYWDRTHRWHPWRSDAERIWWRDHYHDRYWDWRHDRDHDMGWHHDWH